MGCIYVGFTQNDKAKRTINSNGHLIPLGSHENIKTQTQERVVKAILESIRKRKFITTLSNLGKIQQLANRISPWLVEKIIQRSVKKFNKQNLNSAKAQIPLDGFNPTNR